MTTDFITKLPLAQKYNVILVVYNRMTKMAHFVSTVEKTLVERVAMLFKDNIWKLHGLLESIIMDRRVQFMVGIMKELNHILEINTKLSTAYYPQIDSQIERMNQDLEQYLRMFIDHQQEQWLDWLATAKFVYNNKMQTSTKVSPFRENNKQDAQMVFEMKKRKFKDKGICNKDK